MKFEKKSGACDWYESLERWGIDLQHCPHGDDSRIAHLEICLYTKLTPLVETPVNDQTIWTSNHHEMMLPGDSATNQPANCFDSAITFKHNSILSDQIIHRSDALILAPLFCNKVVTVLDYRLLSRAFSHYHPSDFMCFPHVWIPCYLSSNFPLVLEYWFSNTTRGRNLFCGVNYKFVAFFFCFFLQV